MKSTVLALCQLFFVLSVFGQDTLEVPDKSRAKLHADYPRMVARAQWTKESESVYRADFVFYRSRKIQMARFDTAGNRLEARIEIDHAQAPVKVKELLTRKFKNCKPVKTVRYELSGTAARFFVTLEKTVTGSAPVSYTIEVSPEGKLLKTPEELLASSQ